MAANTDANTEANATQVSRPSNSPARTMQSGVWPDLPAALSEQAVLPEHADYWRLRSSYMRVGTPGVVLRPRHEDEVALAIGYAGTVRGELGTAVPFSVRSGGHGISGSSTNTDGIVLDLSHLRDIELLDVQAGTFRVGAGATWGDVAAVLTPHDLALSTGNFGDTGVGGLATAGGVGYLARSQGLTIDHVQRVKLATADGRVRWVDAHHEPDLFWAVRGGATQVGIALEFEITAPRLHSSSGDAAIIHQHIQYQVSDLPAFTEAWGDWIRAAPREAESFLMIQPAGNGRAVVEARNVWANDDTDAAIPTLQAAESLGRVLGNQAQICSYPAIIPTPRQQHTGQQRIQMRDVLVDRADAELGAALAASLTHSATLLTELRALGGAVSDVDALATAWAGRHQEVLAATWVHPRDIAAIDASFAPIQALGTGMYGAYSSDTRPSAAQLTWPGETGRKLRAVTEQADPDLLFDQGLHLRATPTQ
ncbi:hypothetical protein JOF28_001827 [Leucobacter exalbidus]|uniref:FAD-binding PCMH-type domain-containing protein n=1 Tax=Leucobacter exalbidus TaxID=662960 RepID=A0A940T177_9MICO|nr:FAD-dependent oxidoreductase [Leucobacter exalbidus]MBP1326595.1 hypothetical protein [Leucobacter exalbidus]